MLIPELCGPPTYKTKVVVQKELGNLIRRLLATVCVCNYNLKFHIVVPGFGLFAPAALFSFLSADSFISLGEGDP